MPGGYRGGPGLLVAGLLLAALAGLLAWTHTIVDPLVSAGYDEALAAIDRVHAAATALGQLRADQAQLRTLTDRAEQARLGARIVRAQLSLSGDLRAIAGQARSVRASQTALSAEEAVSAWQEAVRNRDARGERSLDGEDVADLDRLASVADAQLGQLGLLATRDGLDLRHRAEAAVVDEAVRLVALAALAGLALTGLAAWHLRRRNRRTLAAAAAAIDGFADGRPEAVPAAYGRDVGALLPALARLRAATRKAGGEPIARRDLPPGLAQALDATHDGILFIDRQDRIGFANAAVATLLGLQPGDLRAGRPAAALRALLGWPHALPQPAPGGWESALADGRRLRVGARPAPDGGLVLVFGASSEPPAAARGGCEADAGTGTSMQTALDTMSQGLCLYDAEHRLVVANRRYEEIYHLAPGTLRRGMTGREVIEASLSAGNHPGHSLGDLLDEATQILQAGDQGDHFQEIAGGRIVQIRVRPTAERGLVATYEDVTERWHAEARIAYMARHDALTDLPNRVLLAERIGGAITQASRETGFAVHCLDLDNFKQINDTLGHAVGDELLRAVAHRLMACLRDTDTVARLGGDEFAIVQADVDRAEDAIVLARHVVEVVSAPYALTDHCVTVGVSIGITFAPAHGMDADRLLKNADVALYRAKGDGRGVFRFFEPEMDARLQARRSLELDLRAAVAAEAFELHYQPIYSLEQERICGFEALLRWTHPTRGRVSPAEFIPLAEEIGLIVPLGDWVLRRACAQAAGWPGELKIAVNVSPAQFRSAALIDTVRESLERTGLAPHRLELEITETVLMANRGATVAILHTLRTIGARISMDDFGTGYSSLSYLRSFPFDKMKIDQSFIRDLVALNGSGFIVKAVISLGSSLGMTMTAEGVETEAQLARLREEGCDEVQGYLFSPPVPAAQVPGLLERWNGAASEPAGGGALAAA